MKAGLAGVLVILSGCVAGPATLPPRPALPAIHYLPRCDPQAVYGLSQEAVDALRHRDLMWQRHVEQLEQQLQRRGRSISRPALLGSAP